MQLHKRLKLRQQCAATIADIRNRCLQTAAKMTCPVHNRQATVRIEGERLEDLKIQIEACCSEFAETVRKAVNKDL